MVKARANFVLLFRCKVVTVIGLVPAEMGDRSLDRKWDARKQRFV